MSNPYFDILNQHSKDADPINNILDTYKKPSTPVQAKQEEDNDGIVLRTLKNIGGSAVGGLVKGVTGIGQQIAKTQDPSGEFSAMFDMRQRSPAQMVSDREDTIKKIDEFSNSMLPIDPIGGPSKLDKGARMLGNVVGQLPIYASIGGPVAKVTDAALSYAPTALRNRAATAVINVTKNIANPKLAAGVTAGLESLPQNIVSGLAAQGAIDPASLTTPEGLAMAAGMSSLGTIFDGVQGWKSGNPNPVILATTPIQPGQGSYTPLGTPMTGSNSVKSPEEARLIYSQLVGKLPAPKVGWWDKLTGAVEDIDRKVFSGKSPFAQIKETNSAGLNFKDAADVLSGSAKIVHESIFDKPMVANSATRRWEPSNTPSIGQILATIPEELRPQFNGLLLARHRLDPGVEGNIAIGEYKHPDMDGSLAKLATLNAPPEMLQAAKMFDDLNRINLDNRLATDLIDLPSYDWMLQNYPAYASASRSLAKDDVISTTTSRKGGSEGHAMVDPVHAYIAATNQTVYKGRINQFANELHDAYERNPAEMEKFLTPEYAKRAQPSVTSADVDKIIADVKKDGYTIPTIIAEKLAEIKKVGDLDGSSGRISYLRDGQPMTMRVNSDMAEAFSVFRPDPAAMKFAGDIKIGDVTLPGIRSIDKVPRTATSLFLDMTLRGPWKDTFSAYINAPKEAGLNPLQIVTNPIRGIKELKNKGKYYYEMVGEGGGVGGRFVGEDGLNAAKTAKLAEDYAKQSGIKFTVMHPLKALEEFSSDISSATRMGAYMRLRDNGMTAAQSAVEARRILTDPFQTGSSAKIRALAAASSFTNTGLQEIRNTARVIARDPKQFALKGLVASAIPSAVAWSLAELNDDEQIREMRNAPGGHMFDYYRLGDQVVGVPRPAWATGQLFGTGMDAFLDATLKGEDSKKRWAEGLINQIGVNIVPLSVQQAYTMKSGQQYMGPLSESVGLVPGAQAGTDPAEMGNSKTSGAAKILADISGIDPFRWDRVMKGMLTPNGYKIEQVLERAAGNMGVDVMKKSTDIQASDIPMLQDYIRPYPTNNTASMRNFYDDYQKYSTLNKTKEMLEKAGRYEDLKRYVTENKKDMILAPTYITMAQELASKRKLMELIAIQPEGSFPAKEKRKRIEQIQLDMISLTRNFNKSMDSKRDALDEKIK